MTTTTESIQDEEEIKLIVFGWIRININSKIKNEINIPITIKQMVSQFTQKCFKVSNVLNIREDLDLIQLLMKQLSKKLTICDLIYRASDCHFDYKQFHEKFDEEKYEDLAGNVVIIKSFMGNIFGGFTSKSWHVTTEGQITDKHAFIFLLKSSDPQMHVPVTFKLKKYEQSEAIYHFKECGPVFGGGHDIFIGKFNNCSLKSYYNENSSISNNPLTRSFEGNAAEFDLEDFEVFGIN